MHATCMHASGGCAQVARSFHEARDICIPPPDPLTSLSLDDFNLRPSPAAAVAASASTAYAAAASADDGPSRLISIESRNHLFEPALKGR